MFESASKAAYAPRGRLARDRVRLATDFRVMLATEFGATLAGSWASDEAHLPRPSRAVVRTLSDVDVRVTSQLSPRDEASLRQRVVALGWTRGVKFDKVSVRRQSDIDMLWNPARIGSIGSDPFESGRFFTFWALVGAIEAGRSRMAVDESGRAYVTAKFFFKLCRNLLLLRGSAPASYQALVNELGRMDIFAAESRTALQIKLGKMSTISRSQCKSWLSSERWSSEISRTIDERSAALLVSVLDEVRNCLCSGTNIAVGPFLERLQQYSDPIFLPARSRLLEEIA